MMQIKIPASERENVRNSINGKIPDQRFFVVDESILDMRLVTTTAAAPKGWHITATRMKEAWQTTMGSNDVVVAVVDDGIDATHDMFKGRFYKAYNVFTQSNTLSVGSGHGTHVAALAAGSDQYVDKGAAAPRCKVMPIQVFDNDICTFSSLASGVMYAIHNGADVVNVSAGPKFAGLDHLPIEEQRQVVKHYFKNEELVWRHIISTANEKNVILVFAAGNDNI